MATHFRVPRQLTAQGGLYIADCLAQGGLFLASHHTLMHDAPDPRCQDATDLPLCFGQLLLPGLQLLAQVHASLLLLSAALLHPAHVVCQGNSLGSLALHSGKLLRYMRSSSIRTGSSQQPWQVVHHCVALAKTDKKGGRLSQLQERSSGE